jgi:hypothetical protein
LDPRVVKEARKEELVDFGKRKVYTKVPLAQCLQKTGRMPIGVRWVDINKGDEVNENYRSRVVGKEFNDGSDMVEDLFAVTPPLEGVRLLLSEAANRSSTMSLPSLNSFPTTLLL